MTAMPQDKVSQSFLLARALAVSAYVSVERAQAGLFAHLSGATEDKAGIIFFKITSARSRREILEKLKRKKHSQLHNLYWNSLIKFIGELDNRRNAIIHWMIKTDMNIDLPPAAQITKLSLIPPSWWIGDDDPPEIEEKDLQEFVAKCGFAERSVNVFHWSISGHPHVDAAWQDIFQQPLAYPPPYTHPLAPKQPAP